MAGQRKSSRAVTGSPDAGGSGAAGSGAAGSGAAGADAAGAGAAARWSRLVWGPPGDPRWVRPTLLAITAAAGAGYAWNINHDGLNAYYAAAVRSMAGNWRLFWFGGFDPAGQITLDKLPGAFWIQALVVRLFGLSTTSLVAPQVIAGVLAVPVLFRAVRATTGPRVALVAAAALAVTPVAAMASRGNIGDGVCVLLLVLAASAAARAVTTGRLRTLLLAAVWVGLAFQVKMIEAWMVLPAFALAYLVAAPGRLRARLGRLSIAGALAVTVSLAWVVAVSLVPAGRRPYADGSRDNSFLAQVFVYNGVARVGGTSGFGLGADLPYSPSPAALRYVVTHQSSLVPPADATRPGWGRILLAPLGGDVGWLLPLALLVLLAGLIALRRRPRADPVRAGLLLWGGWLVCYAVVFSAATVLLNYYLVMLAPAVAALCALGVRMLLDGTVGRWLPPVGLLGGAAWPVLLARGGPGWLPWAVGGLAVLGAVLATPSLRRRQAALSRRCLVARAPGPAIGVAGLAIGVAGLLLGSAVATGTLVTADGGPYDAPFAAGGTLARPSRATVAEGTPAGLDGVVIPRTSTATWQRFDLVRADLNRILDGDRHKLVVFSSAGAAGYVLAGVSGVVPVGGYSGLVDSPSLGQLRGLIDNGTVQWAIVPGPDDPRANDPRVLLIESSCVRDPNVIAGGDAPPDARPRLYVCAHR